MGLNLATGDDIMYKKSIKLGDITTGHIQGIATDKDRQYMYYSFTTCLIKTDMDGNIVGSVRGLAGHLGCIAYNYDDGRVYGSLEFKHDQIGTGILKRINQGSESDVDVTDGFYVAIFDVEKIDRTDMDAEKDGVMTAVHLSEVLDDYTAEGHRHGCSGIDGITFAPVAASSDIRKYLYVAYGIYSDTDRDDNDCQVILRYDISDWQRFEKPLNQSAMHKSGPDKPDGKYFVYTGNTAYGIQNLEYDETTGYMFAAVYRGEKEKFPNYPMFVIDMNKPSRCQQGAEYLSLARTGIRDDASGIWGMDFPYGATGMISLGDGLFYFSRDYVDEKSWGTDIGLYKFDANNGIFEKI